MIVFAAIAPHGDLVLGDEPEAPTTRAALEELGRRHAAAAPETTVVVTPHNAAESAPAAIVRYALRQIAALRRGEPLQNLVDRGRGY